MADLDPREVIIEHLTQPSAGLPPVRHVAPGPEDLPMQPMPGVITGNPFTADRATIQFVKERGTPNRRLYAVSFDDEQHNSWFWLVAAERDHRTGSWVAVDVAGGSGQIPQRSEPWLNLAGSWGQGRLYAGGEIHTAGASVAEVRLTLLDGTQLADDAQADVALFLSDQTAAEPATVDIYDTNGQLLATHAPI
jgi:hypothetical protein